MHWFLWVCRVFDCCELIAINGIQLDKHCVSADMTQRTRRSHHICIFFSLFIGIRASRRVRVCNHLFLVRRERERKKNLKRWIIRCMYKSGQRDPRVGAIARKLFVRIKSSKYADWHWVHLSAVNKQKIVSRSSFARHYQSLSSTRIKT